MKETFLIIVLLVVTAFFACHLAYAEDPWLEICPLMDDLTGDTVDMGEPRNPRSLLDYGYTEEDPFAFEESEYYVYRRFMHGREVIVAFNKGIPATEYGEISRSNFAQYAFNIWDYYWSIFGGYPFAKYTILFLNGPLFHFGAWGGRVRSCVSISLLPTRLPRG